MVVLPTAYFFHLLCPILFAVLWIWKLIGKHLTQNKSLHSCHLDRTMMSQWQEADFNSLRFNHCLVLSVFLSFLSDSRLVIRCLSPLLLWCGMRGKAQKTGPMTQWSCWVWIPDRAGPDENSVGFRTGCAANSRFWAGYSWRIAEKTEFVVQGNGVISVTLVVKIQLDCFSASREMSVSWSPIDIHSIVLG